MTVGPAWNFMAAYLSRARRRRQPGRARERGTPETTRARPFGPVRLRASLSMKSPAEGGFNGAGERKFGGGPAGPRARRSVLGIGAAEQGSQLGGAQVGAELGHGAAVLVLD